MVLAALKHKYALAYSVAGCVVAVVAVFRGKKIGKKPPDVNLTGKTCIVTGANSGIGREISKSLAKMGAKVIMACRDVKSCEIERVRIYNETLNQKLICKEIDFESLKSVRKFAEEIKKEEQHIDVLVNNAGVMLCPENRTEDGFETHLAVNHLGRFLLTNLLLDVLKKSAPSRIVNLVSINYKKGKIDFQDLNFDKHYDAKSAYSASSLAAVLFTMELAKKLEGTRVTVNGAYPGITASNIGRYTSIDNSYISRVILWPLRSLLRKSPEQGAWTPVYCCVAPELENVTGKIFNKCNEMEIYEAAKDPEMSERLWKTSARWTRLNK